MPRESVNSNDHAPRVRVLAGELGAFGHGIGHGHGAGGGGGHGHGSGGSGHGGGPASPGHGGSPAGGGHKLHAFPFSQPFADVAVNLPPTATLLVPIEIASIYTHNGHPVDLPERMAWCTPDMFRALVSLDAAIHARGGRLVLSDLFRTYDMQLQAHLDWKTGKKSAYSPPPGESMHEAGRALDLDLEKIEVGLAEFWDIVRSCGLEPIIAQPDSSASEAWHFDCRGSHGRVYAHYAGMTSANMKPYTAMSVSAVLALGGRVDRFAGREDAAAIQCALIRLGGDPGPIDGAIGSRTLAAVAHVGVTYSDPRSTREELDLRLQAAFPHEYSTAPFLAAIDHEVPGHIID